MHKSRLIRSLGILFLDLQTLRPHLRMPELRTREEFDAYFPLSETLFEESGSLQADLHRLKSLFHKMDPETIEDAWNEFLVLQIMDS